MFKNIFHITSLKANIIANYSGNIWTALISVFFLPFYLKYIGAEGYGLIGFFSSLQIALSLLDSGLSTTLSKELASLSPLLNTTIRMRNLVKTLGSVYWCMSIIAGLLALVLSPIMAKYWIQPKTLSVETITYVFILLSISITFQFPIGFYSGGLLGLQRHIMLNTLRIIFSTFKSIGALLVLVFISKSILVFFIWNLTMSVIQAFAFKYAVWYCLPKSKQMSIFDKQELKNIWRFAVGISGISLTAILLTQMDKIILSKVLSLDQFGYYTIASTIGLMIYQIIGPITQSYFPKLSSLVSIGNTVGLTRIYHQGCQLVSVLVLPAVFILMFYSKELIWIWTQDKATTENTWRIASIIAIGTGLNGLLNLPYQLTLAYGWVKLGLYQNITLLCLMAPLTIFLSIKYGGLGGAMSWLIINVIYLIVTPNLIHNKLLKGEVKYWYFNDTFLPLLSSIFIISISKIFLNLNSSNRLLNLFIIIIIGFLCVISAFFVSRDLKLILNKSTKIFNS